jgi:WD40 repeat protein
MPIKVSCACGKQFQVKDELAGTLTECPACERPLEIPDKPDDKKPIVAELDDARPVAGTYNMDPASVAQARGPLAISGALGCFDLRRYKDPASCLAFSRDGQRALGAVHNDVLVLDVKNARVLRRFQRHEREVRCLCFSPDGSMALSAGDDAGLFRDDTVPICLWDVATAREIGWLRGHRDPVNCVAFSPAGRLAVSGSEDGTIRLWDVHQRKEIDRYRSDAETIECVVFSPDGRRVLAAGDEGIVEVWDVPSGQLYRALDGATGKPTSGAFSPQGNRVVVAEARGSIPAVWQWDLEKGKQLACFRNPSNPAGFIESVTLTSNGQRLISAGELKRLHRQRASGLSAALGGIAETASAVSIAAPSEHGIRIWDVDSGHALETLSGHDRCPICVAVSFDGRHALTGADDGTVRLWGLPA